MRRMTQPIDTPTNERALLAESFELAPAFMAVLAGSDHVVELINPAYSRLVGGRDVIGKPVQVALPEVVEQGFIALLDQVYLTGEPFIGNEVPLLLQPTAGAPVVERYVNFVYQARRDADGEIVGIFVHGVDVTDLVRAREQSEEQTLMIAQQAQAFDRLITNITDFVYTFDQMAQLERIINEEKRELAWSRKAIEDQGELAKLRDRKGDLEALLRHPEGRGRRHPAANKKDGRAGPQGGPRPDPKPRGRHPQAGGEARRRPPARGPQARAPEAGQPPPRGRDRRPGHQGRRRGPRRRAPGARLVPEGARRAVR